jgi:hypothetical protein
MKFNFSFFADQHCSLCKRITFSTFKITGHEQLIISLTLLVLPDGKKLTVFVIRDRKNHLKENFIVELYLNVMRKGG